MVIRCDDVATAFSQTEREKIKTALIEAARYYAAKYGMKKTPVDDLAASAGISKGMFYKLYPSKEMLFFEMLEHLHTLVYCRAAEILLRRVDLPAGERLAEALMTVIATMKDHAMLDFYENELGYLLRKIPEDILKAHYHSDEQHIEELMQLAGFHFNHPTAVVAAVQRMLLLMVAHRQEVGECYPQVLKVMVYSVCNNIVK
jgi:AcrR family transcriptional regulator